VRHDDFDERKDVPRRPLSRPDKRTPREVASLRRRRSHTCWGHLIVAPLWAAYSANLGTLARTCDAVGACLALHKRPGIREALDRGNTLRKPVHLHWVDRPHAWIRSERERGARIVAVELADGATRLADLQPARVRTVVLLGHEHDGVPEELFDVLDEVVEIPMIGSGASLNVAVAGSLVVYRLAGLS
jgi:tRNA G18 (ribose-2'-O)-methylase SpoU